MKNLITLFALPFLLTFIWFNTATAQGVSVGDEAPAFTLKNIDGEMVSLEDYSDGGGVIVVFTCNHCPYSKLYEDRIIELNNKWAPQSYPVVAINPNDAEQYPEDSYKEMKKRAKEKGFTFPYLHDETQEIARAYGATRTPHVFLVSFTGGSGTEIAYIGAIDDNPKSPEEAQEHYLDTAISQLAGGEVVSPTSTKAIGCSIKWKK